MVPSTKCKSGSIIVQRVCSLRYKISLWFWPQRSPFCPRRTASTGGSDADTEAAGLLRCDALWMNHVIAVIVFCSPVMHTLLGYS